MAIDIGSEAIDRASSFAANNTIILMENPALLAGVITDIEIWAATAMEGCKVGTFYGTPPNFTCRDYAVIGDVPIGSKQSFSGLSIDCEIGDYIGLYTNPGAPERDTTGFAGLYYKGGDQFEAGEQAYTLASDNTCSLYGTGEGVVAVLENKSANMAAKMTTGKMI